MDWSQPHVKLFRALLCFYPAEFRHEYGAEMEQLFQDRLRSESRFRIWLETTADVALGALREHWHILVRDLNYGAGILAKSPGFTSIALLVIALGIGACVSVFSVVNAVLLRSLPFGHPDRLVYLFSPNVNFKGVPPELGPNVPDFCEWQRLSNSFEALTLFRPASVNVVNEGAVNRVGAAFVTSTFFQTLEAWPSLGRAFDSGDDRHGHERVAIISDSFWRSQFAAATNVIGKKLQLNRHEYTVIGVMPKGFAYPLDGDVPYEHIKGKQTSIWLPAAFTPDQKTNRVHFDSGDAVGRLRKGVSAAAAQDELVAIERRLQPLYPRMWRGWTALVSPLVQTIVGPVQKLLWLLLGAVGLVLLIAIANIAGLQLVKAAARAHEFGIRSALGAERNRMIRQLLTESLLLSCLGGILGVALAYGAVHVLVHLDPGGIPRFDTASVDGRVLFAAVALSLIGGVLSGIAPAMVASRAGISDLLKTAGSRLVGSPHRARFVLISVEVALSVILLTASGLLIRSYIRLLAVDPGFSPATMTFELNLDERYQKPEQQTAFYKAFLEKIQSLHGVQYAGASTSLPLTQYESATFAEIRGFGHTESMIENRSVTPDYRKAIGTPLLRGRDFNAHDARSPVVIINAQFAEKYFTGRNPIGGQLKLGIGNRSKIPWATIVGVTGNVRHNSLAEPGRPQVFQPAESGNKFAISFTISKYQLIDEIRATLHSLDPALALENVRTMRERIEEGNRRRNFETTLLLGFAAIAIALALAGLYGLMSYTVKHRTAEIGIRLAIGSSRRRILALIVSQGLRAVLAGLFIGLIGAFLVTRLIGGWLFGVKATDPVTFITVPIFVLLVTFGSCLIPAWNAAHIDPIAALRQE